MALRSQVRGAKQVSAGLKELSRYVTQPISTASRYALQPILKAAQANAGKPHIRDTGALADSLTIKKAPDSKTLKQKWQVGPLAGYEKGGHRPVKYAHLVEFGTAPHYQPKRGVTHPGSAAQPFLGPAYEAHKNDAVKRFGSRIGPAMEKRAKQIAAKQGKPK